MKSSHPVLDPRDVWDLRCNNSGKLHSMDWFCCPQLAGFVPRRTENLDCAISFPSSATTRSSARPAAGDKNENKGEPKTGHLRFIFPCLCRGSPFDSIRRLVFH